MPRLAPLPLRTPAAATARRPSWQQLPVEVRAVVRERCGADVVSATSMGSGFTPGFASRLELSDDSRVFVKAADEETRSMFAESYRAEIRNLRVLPSSVPAPALLWSHDTDGWVLLATADVEGRQPVRPWALSELARVLDALESTATALTPAPAGVAARSFADDFGEYVGAWRWNLEQGVVPGWLVPHADGCQILAALAVESLRGNTAVHTDIREDNVLLGADGRVWICDWNWVVRGHHAIDTLAVLICAHGDGHDADEMLAERALTRDLPPEAVDGFLALLLGYFHRARHEPVPVASPWIRAHQGWYADAAGRWLGLRRGWL
ncbi:MAG: aminoglycoside phosphotransferase family protein [Actinomycetota bacterium]|nr:aminoglycoside phosphotransferase family protein [Actinomycetota bacterium]